MKVTDQIITNLGGINNITIMYHCATRLRFRLKDDSKFNKDEIVKLKEIIGAMQVGEEIQIIIGGQVTALYKELQKDYPQLENAAEERTDSKNTKKQGGFMRIINALVTIMSPVVTPLIAAGMLKVVLTILVLFGLSKQSVNYRVIAFMADSVFYFMPFIVACSASKFYKTNQYLGIAVAGALLHPQFLALIAEGNPIMLFSLPVRSVNYSGTIIPIILIIWFMSYVEKFAEKVSPNMIKTMLKPLIIVAVTMPVGLIVLGPIGSYLSEILFVVISYFNNHTPWLIPTLLGGITPLLVMIGMHVSLVPLAQMSLAQYGHESILGPANLACNTAQAGASLAVAAKTKDKTLKQVALSAAITAFSGITEPALYGVTLKLKKPLIAVMISGAVSGFYAGMVGLVRYSNGSPGLLTLPIFIGENPKNIIYAIITFLISLVCAFVLTLIFGWDEGSNQASVKEVPEKAEKNAGTAAAEESLSAVAEGTVIPLENVNDEVFASGVIGPGIAIQPVTGNIYAPFDGKLVTVHSSGHAYGISTESGTELLIHVGINTVRLDGKGFDIRCKEGQSVKKGDLLAVVDLDYIASQGLDSTVMLIIASSKFKEVIKAPVGKINKNDQLLLLK